MIEKIGRINNPLTIIAIFAGLAEVSGTVVLPLLKENIQNTYVWFIMLFPIFLVALFFLVLYFKREVLYAPSDFREDSSFNRFFERSSKDRLDIITDDSVEEEQKNNDVTPKEKKDEPLELKVESRVKSVTPVKTPPLDSIIAKSLLAQELVISKLSRDLNVTFVRNASPINDNHINFDAVAVTPQVMYVVEVKYSKTGRISDNSLYSVFDRTWRFYSTLSQNIQVIFTFFFIIVVDSDIGPISLEALEKEMLAKNQYKYRTILRIMKLQDLLEK